MLKRKCRYCSYDHDQGSDAEESEDEGFAPLVDGLSGALAVLVLVSVSFLIFTVSQTLTTFSLDLFPHSKVDIDKKIVLFNESLSLSKVDIDLLERSFKEIGEQGKVITLYGYVNEESSGADNKTMISLLKFVNSINLTNVVLEKGSAGLCRQEPYYNGCIYWSF
ncbi:hypothetical protein HJA72_004275 [Vibrio fluvialis]|nr:hypothetical protein [Vibrio fluvialis]